MNLDFLNGRFIKQVDSNSPDSVVCLCGKYFSIHDTIVEGSFSPIIGSDSVSGYEYVVEFVRNNIPDGTYSSNRKTTEHMTHGYFVSTKPLIYGELPSDGLVGVWTDEKGNKHIDESIWCTSIDFALDYAKKNNQICIWDIANECEINV